MTLLPAPRVRILARRLAPSYCEVRLVRESRDAARDPTGAEAGQPRCGLSLGCFTSGVRAAGSSGGGDGSANLELQRARRVTRRFSITLRYDISDPFIEVPAEGVALQHLSGVKVLVGYRPDGAAAVLTETDHEDDETLHLIESFEKGSDPADDDARLAEFMDVIRTSHRKAANDIVAMLRWVLARPGGAKVVGRRQSARYIVHGKTEWLLLPLRRLAPLAGIRGKVPIDEPWRLFIQNEAGRTEEPLGHLILHEATDQVDTNPRSAIVLMMTALEVGLTLQRKRLPPPTGRVDQALPWEGPENAITGELVDDLKKARRRDPSRWLTIPTWAAERIEGGHKSRNGVVHEGQPPPPRAELLALGRLVQDVLYMLDYQARHDWALQYVGYRAGDDTQQVFGTPVFVVELPED